MYANGASRQQLAISNHLGVSVSYTTLVGRGRKGREQFERQREETLAQNGEIAAANHLAPKMRHPGTLQLLSQSVREAARREAKESNGLVQYVYDNANIDLSPGDQTLGKTTGKSPKLSASITSTHLNVPDSLQNGTTATFRSMKGFSIECMRTAKFLESLKSADCLKLQDIDLSDDESKEFGERLVHVILRIIVLQGGDGFRRFSKHLRETTPKTKYAVSPEKTKMFPLPAMHIDESSTVGNAAVLTALLEELRLDMNDPNFAEFVKLVAGDQLSIARMRAIAAARVGNESTERSLSWLVRIPGLFHYKINAALAVLLLHLGKPNHDLSNPASLAAHNTLLHRKVIVSTSPPDFRTTRNLINVSLYSRILVCLEIVSGRSIEQVSSEATWDQVVAYGRKILSQFANAEVVDELREKGQNDASEGDTLFENACLFLRDALILREFTDSIKAGDGGRVVTVLKLWTYAFRGSGRTKYAQEAMEFVHNFTQIWDEGQRYVRIFGQVTGSS